MPLAIDLEELEPVSFYRTGDESTWYRIKDGQIKFGNTVVKGADPATFRFFRSSMARDKKHCYYAGRRLKGSCGSTFRMLNYTYATDGVNVWALWSRIKTANVPTFEVCDDGCQPLTKTLRTCIGFAKDKERVYFFDSDGQVNHVRKANPATFVSLNQGYYGKDDSFVFCGFATIPKARVASWKLIGGHYSIDDQRVFYHNRVIPDADLGTFAVLTGGIANPLAKDKNRFYVGDRVVDETEFNDVASPERLTSEEFMRKYVWQRQS